MRADRKGGVFVQCSSVGGRVGMRRRLFKMILFQKYQWMPKLLGDILMRDQICTLSKISLHTVLSERSPTQKDNTVGFHFCELSRIGKSIDG